MKKIILVILFFTGFSTAAWADHCLHGPHDTSHTPKQFTNLSVNTLVHEDAMKGWNLQIKVFQMPTDPYQSAMQEISSDFFTPQRVNCEDLFVLPGTRPIASGHAHLYINEEKVTRIYSPWFYIPPNIVKRGD